MLRDFRIALSAKLCEALGVDLDTAYNEYVFDSLDNIIGPLYMAVGGYFCRISPVHVIQLVCYNFSLHLVSSLFITLFICTLIFNEIELSSIAIIFNFALALFVFSIARFDIFVRRLQMIGIITQIIRIGEVRRFPKSKAFKMIRVFWPLLVSTTFASFLVSTPVYDYLFNGRAYSLPFPLWFPFNTNNPLGYTVAYLFEIYSVHFFCSFVITSLPFFLLVTDAILNEYNSLIDSIKSLHEDALAMYKLQQGEYTNISTDPVTDEEYFDLYKDRDFQYCCEQCLRQIIIQHKELTRLVIECNKAMSSALSMALSIGYISVGTALCIVIIDIGDLSVKANFSAIGLMDLLLIWFICHLSQSMIIKGEIVREELYFTYWYHWPEGMKRSLRIMLVRSLHPPSFSAAFVDIKADYITFTAVVNSTYSLINLVYAFTQ